MGNDFVIRVNQEKLKKFHLQFVEPVKIGLKDTKMKNSAR